MNFYHGTPNKRHRECLWKYDTNFFDSTWHELFDSYDASSQADSKSQNDAPSSEYALSSPGMFWVAGRRSEFRVFVPLLLLLTASKSSPRLWVRWRLRWWRSQLMLVGLRVADWRRVCCRWGCSHRVHHHRGGGLDRRRRTHSRLHHLCCLHRCLPCKGQHQRRAEEVSTHWLFLCRQFLQGWRGPDRLGASNHWEALDRNVTDSSGWAKFKRPELLVLVHDMCAMCRYYYCSTYICGFAAMAYFAMLSGQGWTAIAGCRQFFYARYSAAQCTARDFLSVITCKDQIKFVYT